MPVHGGLECDIRHVAATTPHGGEEQTAMRSPDSIARLAGLAPTLLLPSVAAADWGTEPWGVMVWGQVASLPALRGPALGALVVGLLVCGVLLVRRGQRRLP